MPFPRIHFSRTQSEAAIIEAANTTGNASSGWFHTTYKRAIIYAVCVVSMMVILWQTRGLHPDTPTPSGYILLSFRIFIILTLVLASLKLFFNLREFYSQLQSEDYIPPKEAPELSKKDGGRGDEQDEFTDFCLREGFPLPEQHKPEDVSVQLG
ncbi:uncharacterized protein LOC142777149 [Rhipicephalus microplus]|uniref:uncharacterized protein LOC142777149 n=1 Tax=Rhipicephalus microplus TaxID=6941 RepID=UPI003F6B4F2B